MASWRQKTLATAAGLAGLAGIAGGAYYILTHRPLPKQKGTVKLHGLHEPVEILTDRYGVPHMYAQNADTGTLPLALRWTGLEQCHIIASVEKLNRATKWEEFREALRDWDVPPQNMIYADKEGNIGYVMAGAIPIRSQGQNLLPSPGWTGEYEWTGFIPFDDLPQTHNPQQHFIVTANNRVVNDDYPY